MHKEKGHADHQSITTTTHQSTAQAPRHVHVGALAVGLTFVIRQLTALPLLSTLGVTYPAPKNCLLLRLAFTDRLSSPDRPRICCSLQASRRGEAEHMASARTGAVLISLLDGRHYSHLSFRRLPPATPFSPISTTISVISDMETSCRISDDKEPHGAGDRLETIIPTVKGRRTESHRIEAGQSRLLLFSLRDLKFCSGSWPRLLVRLWNNIIRGG